MDTSFILQGGQKIKLTRRPAPQSVPKNMSLIRDKMADEWVQNKLYSELIANPIWLHAAFTRDSVFAVDENGIRLIHYLVRTTRAKCPFQTHDEINNIDTYIDLVKGAWTITKKFCFV
jgi:hypothetical protein